MFLATSATGGTPSFYLVSGDNAVYLADVQSVAAFKRVGVPVVTLSSAALTSLTTKLTPLAARPWVPVAVDPGATTLIDGGKPNSIYYFDDFDGGADTDTVPSAPPIDANVSRLAWRRGKASDWTTANPVLFAGEPGLETDTMLCKIGDGVHAWTDLSYTVLQYTSLITTTKVRVSPTAPSSPAPGSVWFTCSAGGSAIASPPVPPGPLFFTGTVALSGTGTITLAVAPTTAGTVTLSGTGTLTARGH